MGRPKSVKPLFVKKKMTNEDMVLHRIRKERALSRQKEKNVQSKVTPQAKKVAHAAMSSVATPRLSTSTLSTIEVEEDDDESFIDPLTGAIKANELVNRSIKVDVGKRVYTLPMPTFSTMLLVFRLSRAFQANSNYLMLIKNLGNADEGNVESMLASVIQVYQDAQVSFPRPKNINSIIAATTQTGKEMAEIYLNMKHLLLYPLLLQELKQECANSSIFKRIKLKRQIRKLESTPANITTRYRYDWEKELLDRYEVDADMVRSIIQEIVDYYSTKEVSKKKSQDCLGSVEGYILLAKEYGYTIQELLDLPYNVVAILSRTLDTINRKREEEFDNLRKHKHA